MKTSIILFFVLLSVSAFSQSVSEANDWFNKYEYGLAADSYEKISDKSILSLNDYQNWCYSYFITKKYQKSFALADSIVKLKHIPSYFDYVYAYSAMSIKKYKIAEKAFLKYKNEDNAIFVDSLIASCVKIPLWNNEDYIRLKEINNNIEGADISGMQFDKKMVMFHETGVNKMGNKVADSLFQNTELVFMYPTIYDKRNNTSQRLYLPLNYQNFNVTSFALDSSNGDVFLTMNHVVDKNKKLWAPHLYIGKLKVDSIVDIRLWEYAGMEDSSSTGQATINPKGNLMVFTKEGRNTKGADLYYSKKVKDKWSKPQSFGTLNSNEDEMYPLFIGDSLLSFSSNGRVGYGKLDIYIAKLDSYKVKGLKHFHKPINSNGDDFNFTYYLSPNEAYFTSNREGGKGDDDIYFIQFRLPDTQKVEPKLPQYEDIVVYFDFDKSTLKGEAKSMIADAFQEFKSQLDKLTFEVIGNCDKRGTSAYNLKLGLKRANVVRDYLTSLGVEKSSITTQSDGDIKSEKQCQNGCDEKQYHLDRFVHIRVTFNKTPQSKK